MESKSSTRARTGGVAKGDTTSLSLLDGGHLRNESKTQYSTSLTSDASISASRKFCRNLHRLKLSESSSRSTTLLLEVDMRRRHAVEDMVLCTFDELRIAGLVMNAFSDGTSEKRARVATKWT